MIRQIAGDLNLGLSKLNRWKRQQRDVESVTTPHPDMAKELSCLGKENEILRKERDQSKKRPAPSSRKQVPPLGGVNTVCRAAD
jgi:transposase-like protein